MANEPLPIADGYRGIWYQIKSGDSIKYSGGMATYPQQIRPFAVYRKEANKTFFCYGGSDEKNSTLLHMVSYFDHATGAVPRPRILLDKKTKDAHDNPCISIDAAGHIWIFSNTHGPAVRSYVHRSTEPYSIERFEKIATVSLSYSSPWYVEELGFMLAQNRYSDGRAVAFQTSSVDGRTWNEPKLLAQFKGHYQISAQPRPGHKRIVVAFNYHPRGLDTRTNLYYIESSDFGATWTTAAGEKVDVPLKEVQNAALVHDAEAEKKLVYLKDIQFDPDERPAVLYLSGDTHLADGKTRQWMIAHWSGSAWKLKPVVTSDHNYDFGQLYIEPDGTWRLIAPTDPGAQPDMTGGDVVSWLSRDQGATWARHRTLTRDPERNHTYVRQPIDAHDDFYAFWADGDANNVSPSRLYFTNKRADHVWRLPEQMTEDSAKPQLLEDQTEVEIK